MSYQTITHPKGHIEKIYIDDNPPEPDPIISITSVVFGGSGYEETQEDGRVDLKVGVNVTLTFSASLPNDTKLTIPVLRRGEASPEVFKAIITDGSASIIVRFDRSGWWRIDSDLINSMGRAGVDFSIDSIDILVMSDLTA